MFDFLKSRPSSPSPLHLPQRTRVHLEDLETRCLLSVLTPAQIRHAYGFDQLPYDGSGQTVAVVLANDNPTAFQDLHTFDRQFGLPDPTFIKAMPQGQPAYDPGWAIESSLDLEWAHAIAPRANLMLVEARSASLGDLLGAVDYARHYPGVSVVSMSWGTSEFVGESQADSYFTTPAGHSGVVFVAASGDTGGQTSYPATSPNVVAVGGTSLTVSGGTYVRETVWSGSGGGMSSAESRPAYQVGWQTSSHRTVPDVAYNADPNDGVLVNSGGYWYSVGGTSAGAPQWAGLFALVDQGLGKQGARPLDGRGQALPGLYALAASHYSTDFHDVTSGSAGSFGAKTGYDLVTGLGSPMANNLIPGLISYVTKTAPAHTATNSGKATVPNQGQPATAHLVITGLSNEASLTVLAGGTGPSGAGSLVPSAAPVRSTTSNLSYWLQPPASQTGTTSSAEARRAHSTPVRDGRDSQSPANEEVTPRPADDQATPAVPDSPTTPMPFDPDELLATPVSVSQFLDHTSRPAQDASVVRLGTESQGSVPNTLAAAAALVVIGGVIHRGAAEEADGRRRWQPANHGR